MERRRRYWCRNELVKQLFDAVYKEGEGRKGAKCGEGDGREGG